MIRKMSLLSVSDNGDNKKNLSAKNLLKMKKENSELLADFSSDNEEEEKQNSETQMSSSTQFCDEKLMQVIDNIWDKYDDDGNGSLDIDEARNFVQDILKDLGDEDGNIFSE